MDKRKIRDIIRMSGTILCVFLYIPHIFTFLTLMGGDKEKIISDLQKYRKTVHIRVNTLFLLVYLLHTNSYYRSLFYYRIGPAKALLISWIRPGCRYFTIPASTKIGKGFIAYHPFSTILNAECIGDNFSCGHNTTIGTTSKGRPTIGNNVALGVGSIIIRKN